MKKKLMISKKLQLKKKPLEIGEDLIKNLLTIKSPKRKIYQKLTIKLAL